MPETRRAWRLRAFHDRGQAVQSDGLATPPGEGERTDVAEQTSVARPEKDEWDFDATLPEGVPPRQVAPGGVE